ncbi:hypothetical protein HDU86_000623 [Geranomyces michiganensis]|nr:hypothetical protein HDU86_000623 [Geranomyces michiganensis]
MPVTSSVSALPPMPFSSASFYNASDGSQTPSSPLQTQPRAATSDILQDPVPLLPPPTPTAGANLPSNFSPTPIPHAETPPPPSAAAGAGAAKPSAKKKVALGTQIAKQIIKGAGKKGGGGGGAGGGAPGDFRIDELDEVVLQSRLNTLEAELADYKAKCARHKKENEWYRTEIESCQRDTAEYISYLESKKSEKQSAIDLLIDGSKKDFDAFVESKKAKEAQNLLDIAALKTQIAETEEKIEQKQIEVNGLSDVMSHRSRHEADIARLQREMQDAERQHRAELQELERKLLEERIKVQKETDAKIKEMESAAHEKAHGYLTTHIATINAENERLSLHLRQLVARTQRLLEQKHHLEQHNAQLARDGAVRRDMVTMRLTRVAAAEAARARAREAVRVAERKARKHALEEVARAQTMVRSGGSGEEEGDTGVRPATTQTMLQMVPEGKPGVAQVVFNTSALGQLGTLASLTIEDGDLDWSDEEGDEYL